MVATVEAGLPPAQFAQARRYVCYERNLYYLYTRYEGLRVFPLLYLDRFLDWEFTGGVEPLRPRYNGFRAVLDRHVWADVALPPNDVAERLRAVAAAGHRAAIAVSVRHTDGRPYVTSVLIEDVDPAGVAYLTKFNDTTNAVRRPVALEDLTADLALDDDGLAALTIIRDSPVVTALSILDSVTAYRHIFTNLFGYAWSGSELRHHGVPVSTGGAGFADLVRDLAANARDVLTPAGVPKHQQFRLSKNITNQFEPIQAYLEFVCADAGLAGLLPADLRRAVPEQLARMAEALAEVVRYVGLLVHRPRPDMFERYLTALRKLAGIQPEYQTVNRAVLRAATT
jgi:hypothetical protein